ncbi:MAG: helix-turn-helix domain-containing protein [Lachnospiraceae bacterium]|nr:helix-turn-helix domain-containing protein [Lachnospiraceae bacterium]
MLGDRIKAYRKSKGFTQEELAIRLNIVRQTISKWEKGISVPDAETIQKLADVLEVDVKQLLGVDVEAGTEDTNKEIVEQLARINEQLIIKNRRARRIWKIVGIVLIVLLIFNLLAIVGSFVAFESYSTARQVEVEASVEVIEEP